GTVELLYVIHSRDHEGPLDLSLFHRWNRGGAENAEILKRVLGLWWRDGHEWGGAYAMAAIHGNMGSRLRPKDFGACRRVFLPVVGSGHKVSRPSSQQTSGPRRQPI